MTAALSPERIAELVRRCRIVEIEVQVKPDGVRAAVNETIIALIEERARLIAVAEALQRGERGPVLWDALAAWKAGGK